MKSRCIASLVMGTAMIVSMSGCSQSSSQTSAYTSPTDTGTTGGLSAGSKAGTTEGSSADSDEGTTNDTSFTASDKTYTIGICQFVNFDVLNAAAQGFMDALTEKLGDKVTFDVQYGQGDYQTCSAIVNGFVSNKVDLILANATTPLQAAAAATEDIPVLGTSVTDYALALDITDWTGIVGGNVSGTSDLAPLDEQAAMIKELFPDAETVGLLYCSDEPNSRYQVETIKGYLEAYGYKVEYFSVTGLNDIASVTTYACDKCDVIYIPTDNTVASETATINSICEPAGVPIIAGEEGLCRGCGVATLSINYYDMGYTAGEMAYDILVNGADISTMTVRCSPKVTKKYNAELCDSLGITIPDGYEDISTE